MDCTEGTWKINPDEPYDYSAVMTIAPGMTVGIGTRPPTNAFVCEDSSSWILTGYSDSYKNVIDCQWFANYDPACAVNPNLGQFENCPLTCEQCTPSPTITSPTSS